MIRWLLCATVLAVSSGQAIASEALEMDIWLSTSDKPSALPTVAADVPQVHNFSQESGSVYVWARPGAGKTLERWSLRLTSSNSNVLDFNNSSIEFYNLLDAKGPGIQSNPAEPDDIPAEADDEVRWEFTHGPDGDSSRVDLFGFNVGSNPPVRIAEGIGPTCNSKDQFCGVASDGKPSWLLAEINYTLGSVNVGQTKTTDIFLQIGSAGINLSGVEDHESTADASVRFGGIGDNFLNGKVNREGEGSPINFHPDAQIVLHDTPNANFDSDVDELNPDTDVDGNDFLIWQRGLGKTGSNATRANGDATVPEDDDIVDEVDLAAWQLQYGSMIPSLAAVTQSATVPEPTSGALASGILLVVLAGRRTSGRVRHRKNKGGV